MNHPIENIMKTTLENIRGMIDVNTVIGDSVTAGDGTVIIPVSKVTFGFVAGGGEYGEAVQYIDSDTGEDKTGRLYPFAGGTGAGISLTPTAFLVIGKNGVELMPTSFATALDKLIDKAPVLIEKIQNICKSKSDAQKEIIRQYREKRSENDD